MKPCLQCLEKDLTLLTLHKAIENAQAKIQACQERQHDGRAALRNWNLCTEDFATSYATVKVLGELLARRTPAPEDGRRKTMSHRHTGPVDQACPGCLEEVRADFGKRERTRTIAGILLLAGLVLSGLALLSWYLTEHGPHLR